MTDVFHSTNSGQNWEVMPFSDLRAITTSRIQFTNNPSVLYALHGDFGPDLSPPVKSIDGGQSWSFDYGGNDYNSTYQVIKDPNTGTLYAAVSTIHDLYQSTYR